MVLIDDDSLTDKLLIPVNVEDFNNMYIKIYQAE